MLTGCGNSGNSTQSHTPIQVMDSLDLYKTKGVSLYFNQFYESELKEIQLKLKRNSFPQKEQLFILIVWLNFVYINLDVLKRKLFYKVFNS